MKWIEIKNDESNIPDDTSNCLWCSVPVFEPPYCGSILDTEFPGVDKFSHFYKLENKDFPGQESPSPNPSVLLDALEKIVGEQKKQYQFDKYEADWFNNNNPGVGQTHDYKTHPPLPKWVAEIENILASYQSPSIEEGKQKEGEDLRIKGDELKIEFEDCWEVNKDIPETDRFLASVPFLKIVVVGKTKQEAFSEVMKSIAVTIAYSSGISSDELKHLLSNTQ